MRSNLVYPLRGLVYLLVSSLLAAPAFAGSSAPGSSSAPPKPKPPGKWRFQAELAGRWDDNITELSKIDRKRVGDPAYADQFKIETPGDWVMAPSLRAGYSRDIFGDLSSDVRLDAEASIYRRNSIKDYQTFRLRLAQDLSSSRRHQTRLVLRLGYLPDYYLRELTVEQASLDQHRRVRDSVHFSDSSYSAAIEQVLIPRTLELTVLAGITQRNYGARFQERDGTLSGLRTSLDWTPNGDRRMTLRAGFRLENYDATGDLSGTPALEPDISNRRRAVTAGFTYRWKLWNAERGRIAIDFLRQRRTFTTDRAADRYHFDRHDKHSELSISAWQEVSARFFVTAAFVHEVNSSRLGPGAPSAASDEDVTDYTHDVASISLGWRY